MHIRMYIFSVATNRKLYPYRYTEHKQVYIFMLQKRTRVKMWAGVLAGQTDHSWRAHAPPGELDHGYEQLLLLQPYILQSQLTIRPSQMTTVEHCRLSAGST